MIVTSLQLAELTGKPHEEIKREIEGLLPIMGHNPGRFLKPDPEPHYRLREGLAIAVLTGYDKKTVKRAMANWPKPPPKKG